MKSEYLSFTVLLSLLLGFLILSPARFAGLSQCQSSSEHDPIKLNPTSFLTIVQ